VSVDDCSEVDLSGLHKRAQSRNYAVISESVLPHGKIRKLSAYSSVYAGSIMTASLVFSSITRYA
jgi:hypothetical protein